MTLRLTARHFTARPTLRQFAEVRTLRLNQIYNGITDAHLILAHPNRTAKVAELSIRVYDKQLTAKAEGIEFETAIIACVEQLKRQLIRYKETRLKKGHPFHKPKLTTEDTFLPGIDE